MQTLPFAQQYISDDNSDDDDYSNDDDGDYLSLNIHMDLNKDQITSLILGQVVGALVLSFSLFWRTLIQFWNTFFVFGIFLVIYGTLLVVSPGGQR